MKDKYTYFFSFRGTRKEKNHFLLKEGNAILEMDKEFDGEDSLKEVIGHLKKKEKLTDVVVLFFKLIK